MVTAAVFGDGIDPHDTIVRGLGGLAASPLIVQRTDQDFVAGVLDEISDPDPLSKVGLQMFPSTPGASMRLFQPVHRTFHLALVEAACHRPGQPRLDPKKIDSAGMVIRRVYTKAGGTALEGWMEGLNRLRGWVPFDPSRATLAPALRVPAELADPDPARRPLALSAGNALINRRLADAQVGTPLSERTSPLFVAPPAACAAARRTMLYGVIPTASSEMTDVAPGPPAFDAGVYDADEIDDQVPPYFRAGGLDLISGIADRDWSYQQAQDQVAADNDAGTPSTMDKLLGMLRQLLIQLDAFGDGDRSTALLAALNRLLLPFTDDPDNGRALPDDIAAIPGMTRPRPGRFVSHKIVWVPAGDYLELAAGALIAPGPSGPSTIRLPRNWPAVPTGVAAGIAQAIGGAMSARFAALAPRVPRFEDPTALYVLRAFVRVKRDDGCPPELIWSDASPAFSIAPWYENGVLPPVQVSLPDITAATVKALKPNVSFRVPNALFNMLNKNSAKDLVDGKGKPGDSGGIDWICGFNIPVITICAFIVLFIFLALLNIIFWWLPFIRICIPIPRKRSS